ncbi:MAG: hypothetical protein N3B14_03880 [Thermoleophilia bacterium]|nr:hypothetical protein [Thermoleophilia bacterium]
MACVNPDGRPTESGLAMIKAVLGQAKQPEVIAAETGLPLFRVRSGLRELEAAGFIAQGDEGYLATDKGRQIAG